MVRSAIDWTAMDRDAFGSQTSAGAPVKFLRFAEEHGALDVWSAAFATDFFAFRHDLQAIAERNLSGLDGVAVSVGLDDLSWLDADGDEMIYPIDDDDLFHPDLAATAPAAGEATNVVLWPHGQYAYDDAGHPMTGLRRGRLLFSNNYGLRKSFLRDRFERSEIVEVLADHAAATTAVAAHLGIERPAGTKWFQVALRGDDVTVADRPHGVSLKHVGSLQVLKSALSTDDPVATLCRYRLDERAEVLDELVWAEPWLRDAEDVFAAAQRRRAVRR